MSMHNPTALPGAVKPARAGAFLITRIPQSYGAEFAVTENGGATWPDGSPRPALTVRLWRPDPDAGTGAQVSWPSTSDQRPALARAIAQALALAAREAVELDRAAGIEG